MKVAATSGGLGDIVYSVPIMRELQISTVYVKEDYYFPPYGSLYTAIKSFLQHEGFNVLPTKGGLPAMTYEDGLKFDYDMDSFRLMPMRGRVYIPTNMRRYFKLPEQQYKPWLNFDTSEGDYNVILVTDRWNGSKINWKKILNEVEGKKLFVGFQHEWLNFCVKHCDVTWHPVDDILDMAKVAAGAKAVYCNQGVLLTLAQGMGKKYFLERNPGKTNCLTYAENENLLN